MSFHTEMEIIKVLYNLKTALILCWIFFLQFISPYWKPLMEKREILLVRNTTLWSHRLNPSQKLQNLNSGNNCNVLWRQIRNVNNYCWWNYEINNNASIFHLISGSSSESVWHDSSFFKLWCEIVRGGGAVPGITEVKTRSGTRLFGVGTLRARNHYTDNWEPPGFLSTLIWDASEPTGAPRQTRPDICHCLSPSPCKKGMSLGSIRKESAPGPLQDKLPVPSPSLRAEAHKSLLLCFCCSVGCVLNWFYYWFYCTSAFYWFYCTSAF